MIRVRAFSRLHFGLFQPGGAAGPAAARQFGGVGLMVNEPGLRLHVAPAPDWSADGPLARRVLEFARRFASSLPPGAACPMRLVVEQIAPEHAGLGTGTQLGLSVARALAESWGLSDLSAPELGRRVGRGQRSGLGIHGFAQGGFLVEAGKRSSDAIAPLVARVDFPEDWRWLIALPPAATGLHGAAEGQAFEQLTRLSTSRARTDGLCRLVLLGLLPALVERDFPAFGDALYEFNRLAGETFAPVQGGVYAGPDLEAFVACLRGRGVRGVAQSSWGPAVCAVAEDEDRAAHLACEVCRAFGWSSDRVFVTAARNAGAVVSSRGPGGGSCP